jgi:hypothetical protein
MSVTGEGYNYWTPSDDGRHVRLKAKLPPGQLAALLETYIMHQPK